MMTRLGDAAAGLFPYRVYWIICGSRETLGTRLRTRYFRARQTARGEGDLLTETAFNQLISEYLAMRTELVRFLAARLGQASTAEDIYQEIFVRLKLGQLPEDVGNPRAFIYRMAYNLANDVRRAGQRRAARDGAWLGMATQTVGTEAIADRPDADAAIDARRKLDLMLACIDELPAKCREVFTLHKLQGLSHRDVASRLGVTKKTVEKHMTTALKHLAIKLAALPENGHTPASGQTQGGGHRDA